MPGTCWGNFSANVSRDMKMSEENRAPFSSDIFIFKHQVIANIRLFYFQTSDFFQTTDTLFSNLRYFQTSDTFIFKTQTFSNIWHSYFQTSHILKHLTLPFSNLWYFQTYDIFILNTRSSNFFVVSLAVQSGEGRFCWQLKPC